MIVPILRMLVLLVRFGRVRRGHVGLLRENFMRWVSRDASEVLSVAAAWDVSGSRCFHDAQCRHPPSFCGEKDVP